MQLPTTPGRMHYGDAAQKILSKDDINSISLSDSDFKLLGQMQYDLKLRSDIGNNPEFRRITCFLLNNNFDFNRITELAIFIRDNYPSAYQEIIYPDPSHPIDAVEKYFQWLRGSRMGLIQ